MAEKYNLNLNWDTFSDHLQLMFKDLYQEGRYTDVTLVSDDQTQFKAHKIVLSACSPVFKNIIDSNPSQHPLIYLRGIQSHEVESILQFMYLGEGRIFFERMGEFIKVAQDLEIPGISDVVEIKGDEKDTREKENIKREVKGISDGVEMGSSDKDAVKENEEIEEALGDKTEKTEKETKPRTRRQRSQISNDTKSFQCPKCGAVFSNRQNMWRHIQSKHVGVKYPCNQCDYQATIQGNLQTHIQSKHEGIKYPCNHCDYQATTQSSLQQHIQSKHEGVKYPCNQCAYQATTQSSLQRQRKGKHSDDILQ